MEKTWEFAAVSEEIETSHIKLNSERPVAADWSSRHVRLKYQLFTSAIVCFAFLLADSSNNQPLRLIGIIEVGIDSFGYYAILTVALLFFVFSLISFYIRSKNELVHLQNPLQKELESVRQLPKMLKDISTKLLEKNRWSKLSSFFDYHDILKKEDLRDLYNVSVELQESAIRISLDEIQQELEAIFIDGPKLNKLPELENNIPYKNLMKSIEKYEEDTRNLRKGFKNLHNGGYGKLETDFAKAIGKMVDKYMEFNNKEGKLIELIDREVYNAYSRRSTAFALLKNQTKLCSEAFDELATKIENTGRLDKTEKELLAFQIPLFVSPALVVCGIVFKVYNVMT